MFHVNTASLNKHIEDLKLILSLLEFKFHIQNCNIVRYETGMTVIYKSPIFQLYETGMTFLLGSDIRFLVNVAFFNNEVGGDTIRCNTGRRSALLVCTSCVHFLCALLVCTSCVHFLCALLLCTSVHFFCALLLCTSSVHFFCALLVFTIRMIIVWE